MKKLYNEQQAKKKIQKMYNIKNNRQLCRDLEIADQNQGVSVKTFVFCEALSVNFHIQTH